MSQQQNLPSQVGFYLLPPEQKLFHRRRQRSGLSSNTSSTNTQDLNSKYLNLKPRHWKSQSHLDVINEASDESRASTPGRQAYLDILAQNPKLLRKNTALPGLMFDRPTRHPSLDDLRGYGRSHPGVVANGYEDSGTTGRGASMADKLPPIGNNNLPYDHTKCLHPQSRICENLRYNLHQLRIRAFEDTYQALIDAIVVGPAEVESIDVEEVLGISSDEFLRSKFKRSFPSKLGKVSEENNPRQDSNDSPDDEETQKRAVQQNAAVVGGGGGGGGVVNSVPAVVEYPDYRYGYSKSKTAGYDMESRGVRMRKFSMLLSRPGLRRQFERFARYGEPRASGDFITLNQTEKWFKQAGVIDNWNVTTTDTAIYFRKISKGSKWLDFDNWRIFLEELAWRKRLNLDYLIERLELTGKPPLTTSSYLVNPSKQYDRKGRFFASNDRQRFH